MFKWYSNAKLCTSYLHDPMNGGKALPAAEGDKDTPEALGMVSRGSTLQNLLATRHVGFYDVDWAPLGTRPELANAIAVVTGIPVDYLMGQKPIENACIDKRGPSRVVTGWQMNGVYWYQRPIGSETAMI
ncbi:hypothetical protein PG991_013502 [Apiospora marii]|uniref:Uncharacterized protein n=1 Tax=Apiospora marii TaxID=335849 RepID=A0ABR1R660_9PEZI